VNTEGLKWLMEVVLAVSLLMGASGMVAQTPQFEALERRLASLEKLIEKSSAAREIQSANNADANAKRDEARQHYQEAVSARDKGDETALQQSMYKATNAMFQAVRLAKAPEGPKDQSQWLPYERRLQTVNALRDSYERICKEKTGDKDCRQGLQGIERDIADADAARKAGDLDKATKFLDSAYAHLKVGIEGMRGGETLVRELKFDSPADEFAYEIDRNDTHQMLIKVLVEERLAGKDEMIRKAVERKVAAAAVLREEAEKQAKRGDYDTALKSIDESTRELVRAIRTAGVYIPG